MSSLPPPDSTPKILICSAKRIPAPPIFSLQSRSPTDTPRSSSSPPLPTLPRCSKWTQASIARTQSVQAYQAAVRPARTVLCYPPVPCVNTPTNTARTELHSISLFITRTRVAQELQSSGLHIFVSLKQMSSTCHVSSFAALDTDHQHKFSLTHFIHFSYLTDGLTCAHKPYDSRPSKTLRCSTAK